MRDIDRRRLVGLLGALPIALPAALPIGVALWPRAGRAYLLPTPHVLKKAAARLAGARGLTVTFDGLVRPADPPAAAGRPGAPNPAPTPAEVAVTETWRFGPPLTVEVAPRAAKPPRPAPPAPDPLAALDPGAAPAPAAHTPARFGPGGPSGDTALLPREPTRQLLSLLFADADPSAVMLAIGARRDAQSLALVGERVVHALGAPAGDRRAAQLWIDQDDFTVRRVRFDTDAGPADIRLDGWLGPITEGRFPQKITVTLAGRPVRRLTATAIG